MADDVYPVLLMCGLLIVILLVGIGFSYLWLVWLGKQATKCPKCNKKGAGELVKSEVIHSNVRTEWKDMGLFRRGSSQRQRIQVTEKTYEDHFKCEYCGYQWTTTAQEIKHDPR